MSLSKVLTGAGVALVLAACTPEPGPGEPRRQPLPDPIDPSENMPAEPADPAYGPDEDVFEQDVEVAMRPTQGNNIEGTLTLSMTEAGLDIRGKVRGLSPGLHGMHIHEFGDCSAPDASSAGAHFSPGDDRHGPPATSESNRHAGDLGNISAGPDGIAQIDMRNLPLALEGERSVMGRSVVIHERADDLRTQPDGNSGARVACGVIGAAYDAIGVSELEFEKDTDEAQRDGVGEDTLDEPI